MTRPRSKTVWITLGALVTLASTAILTTGAIAGSVAETTVKVKSGPPPFHGKVKSDDPQYCVADRVVKLKKEKRNGGHKTLGETTTDSDGKWEVIVDPLKSGVYFAKVKKAIDVVPGISCSGAKSELQVVD